MILAFLSLALAAAAHVSDEPAHVLAARYLESLENGIRIEGAKQPLALRAHIFPSALDYELCRRLVAAGSDEAAQAQLAARLKEDAAFLKLARRITGKAGFRLDLLHPEAEREPGDSPRRAVHLFNGNLPKTIFVKFSKQAFEWEAWQDPEGLELKTVRIARHWTSRQYRLVPVTTPLKPDYPRAVLRGEKGSIWGVFARSLLEKKSGALSISIENYDQVQGHYTDEHIIDLNNEANVFERELSMEAARESPFFFPQMPAELRKELDRLIEETGLKKGS